MRGREYESAGIRGVVSFQVVVSLAGEKPSRSRLGMRGESWKVVPGERGCGRIGWLDGWMIG